jgi:hypothetical protein
MQTLRMTKYCTDFGSPTFGKDIRQTDGAELPEIAKVRGDVSGFCERLIQFTEAQGIRLRYEEDLSALGLSRGGEIILRAGLEPAESFATLIHENAHLCCFENYVVFGVVSGLCG